MGINLGT